MFIKTYKNGDGGIYPGCREPDVEAVRKEVRYFNFKTNRWIGRLKDNEKLTHWMVLPSGPEMLEDHTASIINQLRGR